MNDVREKNASFPNGSCATCLLFSPTNIYWFRCEMNTNVIDAGIFKCANSEYPNRNLPRYLKEFLVVCHEKPSLLELAKHIKRCNLVLTSKSHNDTLLILSLFSHNTPGILLCKCPFDYLNEAQI